MVLDITPNTKFVYSLKTEHCSVFTITIYFMVLINLLQSKKRNIVPFFNSILD